MATFRIPYLVVKPLAQGGFGYYWQPSPALARKGWKPVNLGRSASDNDEARIDAAKRRNLEVDAWRAGGAAPRAVKKFTRVHTVAALVADYQASPAWERLAPATQDGYRRAIAIIERWATNPKQPGGDGNMLLMAIGRDRVAHFRDGLMKPPAKGAAPRRRRAQHTLSVLRLLMRFAVDKGLIDVNPALRFDLASPPPRHQIWEADDIAAVIAAAHRLGYPSLALGIEIAEYTAQRVSDIVAMNAGQWREIKNLDRETRDLLAGPDGRVMGIHVRQGKTARWVGIPVAGELRGRIEAAIAANAARAVPTTSFLVDDRTGRPWTLDWFKHRFADARSQAIADGRAELAGLVFHDLRRTAIVRMGELGLEDALIAAVSGHKLASIKTILETYMPRTSKMAARAVVARLGDAAAARAEREKKA